MEFHVKDITKQDALQILNWTYEPPYDLYNNEVSEEGLKELLEFGYSIIVNENDKLVGFFCVGKAAQVPAGSPLGVYDDDFIDIGLGMNPHLTGKGNGTAFFSFIVRYVEERHKGIPLRLTVATFNERAIHLYQKFGFRKQHVFSSPFAEFMTMVKR